MKILVINSGSSSIKFLVYESSIEKILVRGKVARIGEPEAYLKIEQDGSATIEDNVIASHKEGFDLIMEALCDTERGVVENISEIGAVGHRVVHGGHRFSSSTRITDEVLRAIEENVPLAPLHNPSNLIGIKEASRLLPGITQVAVFDTFFHQTMGEIAYLYPLPLELSKEHHVRRYGFHGTSLRYVSNRASEILGRPLDDLRMIICHLGNGITVSAVDHGRSKDTSMGMTPLEGIMMGARCGDVDPGLLIFLLRSGIDVERLDHILNDESGLLGISGTSNDVRTLLERMEHGDERCRLAIEMFTYRIKKYIGAYIAVLGGIDALIFTAGTGEKATPIRSKICQGLETFGISLDESRNERVVGVEGRIEDQGSKVAILVIPTDEEIVIADDTLKIILQARGGGP